MPTPRDPMDDFEMIDPGDRPVPPRRKTPRPGNADGPRRRRPEPEPEKSKTGLFIGLGVGAVLLVGAAAAVLLTGESKPDRPETTMAAKGPDKMRAPVPVAPNTSTSGSPPAFAAASKPQPTEWIASPLESIDDYPAEIQAAAIDGRGRHLFLKLRGESEIRTVDLTCGRAGESIRSSVPRSAELLIAAGMDVVVAVDPATGQAASWPIDDFNAATVVSLGMTGIKRVAMGSATNGPLFVGRPPDTSVAVSDPWFDRMRVFDPKTLQPVAYRFETKQLLYNFLAGSPGEVNSTGTLLVTEYGGYWKIEGDSIRLALTKPFAVSGGWEVFPADGDTLITNAEAYRISTGEKLPQTGPNVFGRQCISVEAADQSIATFQSGAGPASIGLWKFGRKEPLAMLRRDALAAKMIAETPKLGQDLGSCQRLFCVARSNLVIVCGYRSVTIWYADPARQTLADAPVVPKVTPVAPPTPVPVVPSTPKVVPPSDETAPKIAAKQGRSSLTFPGRDYVHQVRVSPVPDYPLKYELQKGPEGMSIDDTGKVTWKVPGDPVVRQFPVVVRVYNEDKKLELTDSWVVRFGTVAKTPPPS